MHAPEIRSTLSATTLDLDDLRDFLMQNPDFVRDDPELLHAIAGTSRNEQVVSIGDLARDRLAARTKTLEKRARWIIETAEGNARTLARTQAAVLCALDAADPYHFAEKLDAEIAPMLGADTATVQFGSARLGSEALCPFSARITKLMPEPGMVWLGPIERDRRWIYGDNAPFLRSEAMARLSLGSQGVIGVFALASREADTFRPDDATDLFVFLAHVIERIVGRWMDEGVL
jgi:uncharacterized protein